MCILQAENPFNEDTMEQTSEVVEPPAAFEYARDYGQMDYEQPMFKVLLAKEIITYDCVTWSAGTWVPTLHRDNPFYGDTVGKKAAKVPSVPIKTCVDEPISVVSRIH